MSLKKACINCHNMFYTGNEQSPLHYGLSAEGYELKTAMEGFDKQLWIVDIKNGKKVWIRKDSIIRITKEEPLIKDKDEPNKTNDIKVFNLINIPGPSNNCIDFTLIIISFSSIAFGIVLNLQAR